MSKAASSVFISELTVKSGFINLVEPGDLIMADKGENQHIMCISTCAFITDHKKRSLLTWFLDKTFDQINE